MNKNVKLIHLENTLDSYTKQNKNPQKFISEGFYLLLILIKFLIVLFLNFIFLEIT